jgi:hypothetical protein
MKRIAGIPLIILGNVISQIINFFKNRVSADAGVFEAESCLESEVVRLRNLGLWDKASLIITPNGYKAGKMYSILPNNGSGDFSFSRASSKRRRNLFGIIESVSNNVPALEYPIVGCPAISIESQVTKLFWPSDPSGTSLNINCTFVSNDWGIGFVNKVVLNNSVSGALFYTSTPTTIQINTTYTATFYVKIVDGYVGIPIFGSGVTSQGYLNFCGIGVTDNNLYQKISLGNNIWKVIVSGSGSGSVANTGFLRWTGNRVGSIEVTGIELEPGTFSSSYINAATGATTRLADSLTLSAISNLLGASEGTIICNVELQGVVNKGNNTMLMLDNGINNYLWFRKSGTNLQLIVTIGGVTVSDAVIAGAPFVLGVNRIAFSYKENEKVSLFINGNSYPNLSNIVAVFSAFSRLAIGASAFGGAELNDLFRSAVICKTRLSNSDSLNATIL